MTNLKERSFFDEYFEKMKNDIGNFIGGDHLDDVMNIFMGGGGCKSKFYIHSIEDSHQRLGFKHFAMPKFSIQEIPNLNPDIILHDKEFSRYVIAIGLSYPEIEKLEYKLPSRIENEKIEIKSPKTIHGVLEQSAYDE